MVSQWVCLCTKNRRRTAPQNWLAGHSACDQRANYYSNWYKDSEKEYIRLWVSICWTIFVGCSSLYFSVCSLSDAIIVSNGQRQRQTFYLLDQAWKKGEVGDNARQNCDYSLWDSKRRREQKRRMMIINELADHLITMALITQLNANCPRREWPLARPPPPPSPSSPLAKVTIKGQQQQQQQRQSIGENRQKCNWRTVREGGSQWSSDSRC